MSRRFIFIVSCVIAGLGCNPPIPVNESAVPVSGPAIPRSAEAFEPSAAIDNTILKVVLTDLRTYDENGRPFSLSREIPRDIYFSPEPIGTVLQPAEPLESNDVWSKMTETERRWTQEGIRHLEERSALGDSFREFRATSEAIHVVDGPTGIAAAAPNVPYSAQFPIRAWAPGYSHDGSCAVLHLFFDEILHPSYATYVLVQTDGTWKIVFRGFITYV